MEPFISERFIEYQLVCGLSCFLEQPQGIYQHPQHSWMLGNPDRLCFEGGTVKILELKNTSAYLSRQIKELATYQVHWYMAILNLHHAYLALWEKTRLRVVSIPRSQSLIEEMIEAGQRFWFDCVLPQKLPEERTMKYLTKLCQTKGVKFADRGYGHFQFRGKSLVNYYPFSKGKTAYVAGTKKGVKNISHHKAVQMAM